MPDSELPPDAEGGSYFDSFFGYYLLGRQETTSVLFYRRNHDSVTGQGYGVVIFSLGGQGEGDPVSYFMDVIESHGYFEEDVSVTEAQPLAWVEEWPDGYIAAGLSPSGKHDAARREPGILVFQIRGS